jgi:hypothetical protein
MNRYKEGKFLIGSRNGNRSSQRFFFAVALTTFCAAFLGGCGTGGNTSTQSTSSSPASLPVWTNSFSVGGVSVPFTMVGTDPSLGGGGTTSVPVQIIPVRFNFGGIIISPETNACGDTASAISRVQNSPLFTTNTPWSDGGTPIGTTQFTDAYQRANFWRSVSTVSPNYHVMLQPISTLAPVSIDVPLGIGAILIPNPVCPQHPIGGIPSTFMDSVVQNVIQTQHISPGTLPVFLTFDIQFEPQGFLGYHSAFGGTQTFVVASYTDPGLLGFNVADVHVLSHELGEWMNNPMLINKVPAWGTPATGCSSDLEVGDPLAQSNFTVVTSGFTYHIQELAYFSWFARNVPSIAINGRYSVEGTFIAPALPCP